jgi:transcriptional regulator with XRE-family HTH domain
LGPERAFGQALREFREAQKISQEDLAYQAGFDRTYVSMIERGLRSPTIRSLVRLAQTLNLRPSQILARMEQILSDKKPAR